MSALLHIGEADHKLLCADAEIGAALNSADDVFGALNRARQHIAEAHGMVGAVRLALRCAHLAETLAYHQAMAAHVREIAPRMYLPSCHTLRLQGEAHERRAAALRVLIGKEGA